MTDYKNLLARHGELNNDFRRAIVELLATHGERGRIVYRPEESEEDDDITDYDGDFPVTLTLWGEHRNPNVNLTEVYLAEDGHTVYARGIDQDEGDMCDEDFEIHTDQYYGAFCFILTVLTQQGVEL
jgi:hypothetical protein